MKKIVMLAGLAAAAYGAMKLLKGGKDEDYDLATPYDATPYAPSPQG